MPRRRKETLLEQNLVVKGYKLLFKTYEGKKSEKVDSYVYGKSNGYVDYRVHLDSKRVGVKYFCFTDKQYLTFTSGIIESLQEIDENFKKELSEIYDFENKCAKELEDIGNYTLEETPFIEEHFFDEGDNND